MITRERVCIGMLIVAFLLLAGALVCLVVVNSQLARTVTNLQQEVSQLKATKPSQPPRVIAHPGSDGQWSPNGKLIISIIHGKVDLWDSTTGQDLPTPVSFVQDAASNQWSIDSKHIVTQLTSGWVLIWQVGSQAQQVVAVPGTVSTWSPRGSDLALVSGKSLQVVDVEGKTVFQYKAGSVIKAISWSPDGKFLEIEDSQIQLVPFVEAKVAQAEVRPTSSSGAHPSALTTTSAPQQPLSVQVLAAQSCDVVSQAPDCGSEPDQQSGSSTIVQGHTSSQNASWYYQSVESLPGADDALTHHSSTPPDTVKRANDTS